MKTLGWIVMGAAILLGITAAARAFMAPQDCQGFTASWDGDPEHWPVLECRGDCPVGSNCVQYNYTQTTAGDPGPPPTPNRILQRANCRCDGVVGLGGLCLLELEREYDEPPPPPDPAPPKPPWNLKCSKTNCTGACLGAPLEPNPPAHPNWDYYCVCLVNP